MTPIYSSNNPYQVLGADSQPAAEERQEDLRLRLAYRQRILDYKADRKKAPTARRISAEDFRQVCRAYETLGDRDKRRTYNTTKQWISEVSINDYDLHQLAAEPELIDEFRRRVQKKTLAELNKKLGFTEQTPLYCAARACNVEAVEFLVEQDVDPDITQRTGSTALHAAAFFQHPEIVECLLSCGANYNKKNYFGNLAETEAKDSTVSEAFEKMKRNPYVQVAAGDFELLKKSISETETHIDQQFFNLRQTLLHCAAKKGHFDIVRWLIEEKRANLDIIDRHLNSPLHLAASRGHPDIVQFLLQNGADSTLINEWGFTAQQEGLVHGDKITAVFQSIQNYNMFEMAEKGHLWWFQYHFDVNNVNTFSETGATLLYVASKYGQVEIARFLLDKGANINEPLKSSTKSTPLHGAVYNNKIDVVKLLLSYGADISIRNTNSETIFDNIQPDSDEMQQLLEEYRKALVENRILTVHIYGDGLKSGDDPLATIKLPLKATLKDLKESIPAAVKPLARAFTIARRPLRADNDEAKETLISLYYRSRYAKTKLIESPLCLTGHESPRYINSGHSMRENLPAFNGRYIDGLYRDKFQNQNVTVKKSSHKETKRIGNILFTFNPDCVKSDVTIEVKYIEADSLSKDLELPGCVVLFKLSCRMQESEFTEMPVVSWTPDCTLKVYMLVTGTGYWFTENSRRKRCSDLNGYYAFVKHASVIGGLVTIPRDMIITASDTDVLHDRTKPLLCKCLKLREHNRTVFPHLAYHGTNISVIQSILMDSLVMPSTIVSSGKRVVAPANHIARGVSAFGIPDFSNAIFVSPSIHYCSDPAYAVTFDYNDRKWIAVLEIAVKEDSFKEFKSTVPGYKPHPDDDISKIEWRLTNPGAFEILSVLFIAQQLTRAQIAALHAEKLGIADPFSKAR